MARNILIPWTCPECGEERIVQRNALKRSPNGGLCMTCFARRMGKVYGRINGLKNRTHGERASRELMYGRWCAIKARCLCPTDHAYENYGARGITICERWRDSYEAFRDDMGPCPGPEYSIDRFDNDGPYSPENCRWATLLEQSNNRRTNRVLSLNGESHTIAEWSRKLNISMQTLLTRLSRAWTVERALTTPIDSRHRRKS